STLCERMPLAGSLQRVPDHEVLHHVVCPSRTHSSAPDETARRDKCARTLTLLTASPSDATTTLTEQAPTSSSCRTGESATGDRHATVMRCGQARSFPKDVAKRPRPERVPYSLMRR